MFYDIIVTAIAVAITLFVWFTIGFALTQAGALKWLSKLTISNPPAWIRKTIFIVLTLTVLAPCSLYLIVLNAIDSLDINRY